MTKVLLLSGVAAFLAVTSAKADNISLFMANGAATESVTGTDSASLAVQNLGGVTISLSTAVRGTNPDSLTAANINVDNTTGNPQTLSIIAAANGYAGPADNFLLTSTIGVTSGVVDFAGSFLVDPTNTLNGNVVGTSIGTFDTGSVHGPQSVSENLTGMDAVNGPYGMAELLTLTLQPGAMVFVDGASMEAEPIPGPVVGAGLPGIVAACGGLVILRRRRRSKLIPK
jgi:hypothetical protein